MFEIIKKIFHVHSSDVLLNYGKCICYDSMGDPSVPQDCEEYKCLKCGKNWWKLPPSLMGYDIFAIKSTAQYSLF